MSKRTPSLHLGWSVFGAFVAATGTLFAIKAYQSAGASQSVVTTLTSTSPLFVFGFLVLMGREGITLRSVLGTLLVVAGCALLAK